MANSHTYGEVWQICLDRIKQQTSQEEFARWFEPIKPLAFDGTHLKLKVPNESYVSHIEKNYLKQFFAQIIYQLYGKQTRVLYAVPNSMEQQSVPVNADTTANSIRHRKHQESVCYPRIEAYHYRSTT